MSMLNCNKAQDLHAIIALKLHIQVLLLITSIKFYFKKTITANFLYLNFLYIDK